MKVKTILALMLAFTVFATSGCAIFSKHSVKNKTPLETETFAEKPEHIMSIKNGKEKSLKQEEIDFVCSAFEKLYAAFEGTSSIKGPFSKRNISKWKETVFCLEFRYDQRRKFTGELKDDDNRFSWGDLQYDALLLIFWSGAVIAVPYRGSSYRDVDGLFLVLTFPADDMNAFLAAVSES